MLVMTEETIRLECDFQWLELVLKVPFTALTLLVEDIKGWRVAACRNLFHLSLSEHSLNEHAKKINWLTQVQLKMANKQRKIV